MPYEPIFEFTGISSSAAGANADITFRTRLLGGNHILGTYGLEVPENSWNVAAHSNQLNGKVTVVGSMTINLDPDGNCNDGDSGAPQTYAFPLLDQDPGSGGPYAMWGGRITDFGDGNPNTNWDFALTVEQLGTGFTIDGFVTSATLPAGNAACTPQLLTLTLCGRANPAPTATVCGSGNDTVVMTNPGAAGCYLWQLLTVDESGRHSANPQAGVSIGGTPCDADADGVLDPSDNCPRWPNPLQNPPPWQIASNDPDCDGFSTAVENSVGTNPLRQCGYNGWPADFNTDQYSDIFDITPVTANFGVSVPPGPVRQNIAPDPPDGFIDIFDITRLTALFGLSCAPCSSDSDCDAVPNLTDNCPNWPNPAQLLPPWTVPTNDPDCDGFSTVVENSAGTNPLVHCGVNAWPADLNNDKYSDIFDITLMTANFAVSVPPGPARQNIAPNPPDGYIDIFDITRLTAVFSLRCE